MRIVALLPVLCVLALASCRSVSADPACAGRTAADAVPTRDAYRALTLAERRAENARFDELARRCGWEP